MSHYVMTAESLVSSELLDMYGVTSAKRVKGQYMGVQSDVYVIDFPNMVNAASWVDTNDLTEFATMVHIGYHKLTFDAPVKVSFAYDSYQDTADHYHAYDPNKPESRADQYIRDYIHRKYLENHPNEA